MTTSNKVAISTIHKAKGLEWSDVYVPYFNEKFMPIAFREENHDRILQRVISLNAVRVKEGAATKSALSGFVHLMTKSLEARLRKGTSRKKGD